MNWISHSLSLLRILNDVPPFLMSRVTNFLLLFFLVCREIGEIFSLSYNLVLNSLTILRRNRKRWWWERKKEREEKQIKLLFGSEIKAQTDAHCCRRERLMTQFIDSVIIAVLIQRGAFPIIVIFLFFGKQFFLLFILPIGREKWRYYFGMKTSGIGGEVIAFFFFRCCQMESMRKQRAEGMCKYKEREKNEISIFEFAFIYLPFWRKNEMK